MSNDILDNLQSQLDEIEMLQSMFPDENELVVDNFAVDVVRQWLVTPRDMLPSQLDLSIKLNMELDSSGSLLLEILVSLPHDYPGSALPEIYARQVQSSSEKFRNSNNRAVTIEINRFSES